MSTHHSAWTPGRIASISVLAVAMAAFVVDKVFLGQSDPASASADQALPIAGPSAASNAAQPAESLAHRLEHHRQEASVAPGQAFIAPAGFYPQAQTPAQVDGTVPAAATEAPIEWPKLSAVVTGASPGAVLDGRLWRVGEVINGIELIAVSERSVTMRRDGREGVLSLDETQR